MNYLFITHAFTPIQNSCAVQMYNLATFFHAQGHQVTVLTPSSNIASEFSTEDLDGLNIIKVRLSNHKNINYVSRFFIEFFMPFIMLSKFKKTSFYHQKFDGIIWYSPSIFFGYLIYRLKKIYKCKTYLILRDIFPEWSFDLGIISNKFQYNILKLISYLSYIQADTIGVQSPNNKALIHKYIRKKNISLEVLWNWSELNQKHAYSSIQINNFSALRNKKILLYTGNMGLAQNVKIFMELAKRLSHRANIAFLFVGMWDQMKPLMQFCKESKINNIVFHQSIPADEIPALYSQCHIGLFSLDLRHKTHNIPGKVISYLSNSLPVLGNINPGNDLINIINQHKIGAINTSNCVQDLQKITEELLYQLEKDSQIHDRCKKISQDIFSIKNAYEQIFSSF